MRRTARPLDVFFALHTVMVVGVSVMAGNVARMILAGK